MVVTHWCLVGEVLIGLPRGWLVLDNGKLLQPVLAAG
jgi:hypothetical protein